MCDQVRQLIHVPNTWYTEAQGQLAQALSERTGWTPPAAQCFFCNSGTEAVEAAIKLARLNGKPGRYKIVATLNTILTKALKTSEVQAAYAQQGMETLSSSQAEAAQHIERETAIWKTVIADAGIRLE